MTDQIFLEHFILYGKVAGASVAFGTVTAVLYRALISPVVRKVVHINETVSTLAVNCIPTIQRSLDAQDIVLKDLRTDVTKFGQSLNETKNTVSALDVAFTNHLESVSKEKVKKRR